MPGACACQGRLSKARVHCRVFELAAAFHSTAAAEDVVCWNLAHQDYLPVRGLPLLRETIADWVLRLVISLHLMCRFGLLSTGRFTCSMEAAFMSPPSASRRFSLAKNAKKASAGSGIANKICIDCCPSRPVLCFACVAGQVSQGRPRRHGRGRPDWTRVKAADLPAASRPAVRSPTSTAGVGNLCSTGRASSPQSLLGRDIRGEAVENGSERSRRGVPSWRLRLAKPPLHFQQPVPRTGLRDLLAFLYVACHMKPSPIPADPVPRQPEMQSDRHRCDGTDCRRVGRRRSSTSPACPGR